MIRNYENDISEIENQVIGIYSKKVCLLKIYQGTLKVFMEWIYIIN
ncbi:putative transposase, mutator type [Clostridioides difficile CD8]|nr:putative transposase, mutator type [Clostridioides difficile CD8]EQJ17257.1 putative transposase, mutator type [Clostridioides difficile P13]EQJ82482.1 putative transposase, mutator type [Clostridioides difficile P48]EQK15639.1 putative transposase, mutator type [Clostridioides difficile P70]EQK32375.1 putative transposase, mutator type [Clostridioides difficile P75]ERM34309.1 putative transposase, mutator type [Clostridioides difficile P37]